jgi:radical SAM superfamily enzyme YgiQ (UPF0313 family)
MTRLLVGQAYYLRFDPKLEAAGQPYAPLGALYAAASARQAGYNVSFFDAMLASSEADWAAALDGVQPDVAVIYEDSFNYLSKMCLLRMREAAITMIRASAARGVPVLVSGSDATDHPDVYLDAGARAVIAGEGEVTLVEALDVLTHRTARTLREVPGLRFREAGGGVIRSSGPRPIIRDLTTLPRPAWDLLDVERYRTLWRARHGFFSMNVVTTRGCPYHCNWCAKPIYGQRYTVRPAAHVADEIAWLKTTYAPDHLWMADDIFGLKPGWIEDFADCLVARNAVIPFKCLLRADGVNEAVVRALVRAGCRTAWIGAESGSQRILDAMEKGTRVGQIRTAASRLHDAGIEVGFFLQFGYPGERLDDIARTLTMVRECRPDDIGISVSYPLPGTLFYERVKAQLGAKQNWIDSNDLAMMYRAEYVPEFYRCLHALVHAEFRSSRAFGRQRRLGTPALGRRVPRGRQLLAAAWHAARAPFLRIRLRQLARARQGAPTPQLDPVLTQRAAATPSEQT